MRGKIKSLSAKSFINPWAEFLKIDSTFDSIFSPLTPLLTPFVFESIYIEVKFE